MEEIEIQQTGHSPFPRTAPESDFNCFSGNCRKIAGDQCGKIVGILSQNQTFFSAEKSWRIHDFHLFSKSFMPSLQSGSKLEIPFRKKIFRKLFQCIKTDVPDSSPARFSRIGIKSEGRVSLRSFSCPEIEGEMLFSRCIFRTALKAGDRTVFLLETNGQRQIFKLRIKGKFIIRLLLETGRDQRKSRIAPASIECDETGPILLSAPPFPILNGTVHGRNRN